MGDVVEVARIDDMIQGDDAGKADDAVTLDDADASPCCAGRRRRLSGRSSSAASAATPSLYAPAPGKSVRVDQEPLAWPGFLAIFVSLEPGYVSSPASEFASFPFEVLYI